jgi:hypothetical protein
VKHGLSGLDRWPSEVDVFYEKGGPKFAGADSLGIAAAA